MTASLLGPGGRRRLRPRPAAVPQWGMSELADNVLPLIRTRADLHRRGSTAHGKQMSVAVDRLAAAAASGTDPQDVLSVTQKAIASATTLIMRADDSSGYMGDAIRGLLALHPQVAVDAKPTPSKLVKWMIDFQFHNECDFFTIDPVAYAPALGKRGIAAYRAELEEIREALGPPVIDPERPWAAEFGRSRFALAYNDRRLAVLDRDVDKIIDTHARRQPNAAFLQDTAIALAEIGEIDLAIEYARKASDLGSGFQSQAAAGYLSELISEHRPTELLSTRLDTFARWPSFATATDLHEAAGDEWPDLADDVLTKLADRPAELILFLLRTLGNVECAWQQAHSSELGDEEVWLELVNAYETIDPVAALGPLQRIVEERLATAHPRNYRQASRVLTRMRRIAAGTTAANTVSELIDRLRTENRHRPRLQAEFDQAGLE
ncbi:hypothetical protein MTX80_16835 [Gordonia amicalis]|nr:hypothetical protein MTX80_16835 [Gordonia amicalis]